MSLNASIFLFIAVWTIGAVVMYTERKDWVIFAKELKRDLNELNSWYNQKMES